MAKSYVKFEVPGPIKDKTLEVVEAAKGAGGVRKGTNEATKAIERGEAKIVVIAEDVEPEEIVMHIPILCGEKNVPYTYVAEKVALGKAAGLSVGTAAVAVTKAGSDENALRDLLVKIRELQPSATPAVKKVEKAEAEKPEKAAKPKKAPAAKKKETVEKKEVEGKEAAEAPKA